MISGASRGIGRATAIKFASEGYDLSICSVERFDLLEDLRIQLESEDCNVLAMRCDISKSKDVEQWTETTIKRFSKIDAVVSNAGIALYSLIANTTEDAWDLLMDTNLKGAFLLARAVYDHMVSQKFGSIVFLSSIWGKQGAAMEAPYACSKAGLIALTKSLAKELGPSNIRVNAIAPGGVDTDMLSIFSQEDLEYYASITPLGRLASPEEIAESIFFLASEKSSFTSGAVLSVDGGNS